MDGLTLSKRFVNLVEKYKYALAVALVGILLMLLPVQKPSEEPETTQPEIQEPAMEEMLEEILKQIEGAGNVKVLLTKRTGEETLYQSNVDESEDSGGASMQSQTVVISDENRSQTGLVRRTDPPLYLGALIVCQGGDSPQIRLAIVEAVSCVTGLSTNQIAVLKMK